MQPDPYLTRATLLLKLKDDSPARELAWEEFYEIYRGIIAGFARNMGVPNHDIPDVVQEVLVGFFGVSPTFMYNPSRGRFRGYLKTCAWRVFQRRLQSRLRVSGRPIEEIADDELHVEKQWNDVWESEKLQRALEIVRDKYLANPETSKTFQAFEMYSLLDQPAPEIALELGMSINSVHQAKTRVSKSIKKAMEDLDVTFG